MYVFLRQACREREVFLAGILVGSCEGNLRVSTLQSIQYHKPVIGVGLKEGLIRLSSLTA